MQPAGSIHIFCFSVLLLAAGVIPASALSVDEIAANVMLGQIYPSGNAYLKGFGGTYPSRVLLRGNTPGNSIGSQFQYGNFAHALQDSSYIPGMESMDDAHSSCGAFGSYQRNSGYSYLTTDFFLTSFAYCDANENVAMYRTAYRNNQSYPVIGLGVAITPEDMKILDDETKRPLLPSEQSEVDAKKANVDRDCHPAPGFLDDAVQIAEIHLSREPYSLRLSRYESSSCDGQSEAVFILDVFENQDVVKRFDLHQRSRAN